MRFSTASTLAVCVAAATAFKNTSPFLLFSTADSNGVHFSPNVLQSSKSLLESTKAFLDSCSSDTYVIVSQPNVGAADFASEKAVPQLRRAMANKDSLTSVSVSEVVGGLSADEIQLFLVTHCGADVVDVDLRGTMPSKFEHPKLQIVRANLPALPSMSPEREATLADHDALLKSLIIALDTKKYTVIYTTTPVSDKVTTIASTYEPTFEEPMHMDLKRRTEYTARADNYSTVDPTPLFEKYQFFTPGLFMGLLVTFLLLSILTVGISGVAGLQVSYGAFDKEMGPAAQKKAQ